MGKHIAVIVLLLVKVAAAQMSIDQAMARLRARQGNATTTVATSRPAVLTDEELAATDVQLQQLAAQASSRLSAARIIAQKRLALDPRLRQADEQLTRAKEESDRANRSGTREQREKADDALREAKEWQLHALNALAEREPDVAAAELRWNALMARLISLHTVDLLDELKHPQDFAIVGTWRFKGNALTVESDVGKGAGILFPSTLRGPYLLRIVMGSGSIMDFAQICVPVGPITGMIISDEPTWIHKGVVFTIDVSPDRADDPIQVFPHLRIEMNKFPTPFKTAPIHQIGLMFGRTSINILSVKAVEYASEMEYHYAREHMP